MGTPAFSRRRRLSGPRLFAIALILGLGLESTPVLTQESTDLQTLAGKKKHRKRQGRPIMLGTSGGNINDSTIVGNTIYCCGGTLGALVEKGGLQYIISNNHVLARSNSGRKGEAIIQPGFIDQSSCLEVDEAADTVAHLAGRKKLKFGTERQNKVDLAIAEVVPGAVRSNGEILRIGVPGSVPATPFIGMEVQKAGRTTGITRGFVAATQVTVQILQFPLDCAGTETRYARFVNQIIISGFDGQQIGGAGDSGSMFFEDRDNCPAPVGLLFAGGDDLAAASPATTILQAVRKLKPRAPASFVGCGNSSMQVATSQARILRPERVHEAVGVKEDWENRLLDIRGIQAVGVGMTLEGAVEPAIYVFATDNLEALRAGLPDSLDGFRVEIIETDGFKVYCGR